MPNPAWTLPTTDELDTFLALTIAQRGERLLTMTPSARIAMATAIARRAGSDPYRELRLFEKWMGRDADELHAGTPS